MSSNILSIKAIIVCRCVQFCFNGQDLQNLFFLILCSQSSINPSHKPCHHEFIALATHNSLLTLELLHSSSGNYWMLLHLFYAVSGFSVVLFVLFIKKSSLLPVTWPLPPDLPESIYLTNNLRICKPIFNMNRCTSM